ncbi:MAG: ABC transporter substrate-binding protein [Desulfobacteraceae bacterium]|nr:ABC transporter substrate-binding protein [Desulfobacteraceae bacterium]
MKSVIYLLANILSISIFFCAQPLEAKKIDLFKVLVVMSYHAEYQWQQQVKAGIDTVLGDLCKVRYFDLDTKRNPSEGHKKADEAYTVYKTWQPDGVITADDNAQSMFVVPYLKNKVSTPVIFCGVNADPQKYGYPAVNVSGILERHHLRESLMLVKQLVPAIKKVGVIAASSPSNIGMINTIKKELHSYPVQSFEYRLVDSLAKAVEVTKGLHNLTDALHIMGIEGLLDDKGERLSATESTSIIAETYGKPTIGVVRYEVEAGALCAVIHQGQEQGATAARMLLDAMHGKQFSELPITRNRHGQSIINVTVLRKLDISPSASTLKDTILVETKK